MFGERFWRGYDWVARADLALGWIFDWRKWLWGLVPTGAGMTFLWAAIEGRSPLDVWIAAVVFAAALAVLVYFLVAIVERMRKSAPRAGVQENDARLLAIALDDLYAEAVNVRNHLIPADPDFDWETHHAVLKEWDDRVLAHLNSDHVPVGSLSRFRTLNRFDGVYAQAPGKSDLQCQMESIWTEKLKRLQAIIDELG